MKSPIRSLVAACLFLTAVPGAVLAQPYTFRFVNHTSYDPSDIYIFSNDVVSGSSYDITYNNGTQALDLQTSVTLSDLLYGGNYDLTLNYSKSLALYVGLGTGSITPTDISNNGLPSYTGGLGTNWYNGNYGYVEASVTGVNDNADVTAINSIGVPMNLKDATGNQSVGFTDPSKLAPLRAALNSQIPATQYPNNSTSPIRYLGPNQAQVGTLTFPGSTNPNTLPAFTDYFNHVKNDFQAPVGGVPTKTTKIEGQVSIKQDANHNWQYDYSFHLEVTADNQLQIKGDITFHNTIGSDPDTHTLTGLVATIAADGTTNMDASNFIYAAQASYGSSIITLSNTGADTWQDLATLTGLDFQSIVSPYVVDDIIAYISAGFAFGFVGSEVTNPMTGNAFGDDPSSAWFADGQTLAFADVQPDSPYYSLYSKLLNEASTHVYSHPYSDRFQDPSFENSINLTTGDVMEIHIYDFDTVPEPSTYFLIVAGLGGLAGARYLRRRRI